MNRLRPYFLTTERLGIGHWQEDDLPLARMLWEDPQVSVFLGGPFDTEQVRARLARQIRMKSEHRVQYWPVFRLADGDLAGCTGLQPYGDGLHMLELGIHFRPQYWGQGVAHEAASAVIHFAFERLGVPSLFAGHHPQNAASGRLLRRLGFRYTGEEVYPPTGDLEPAYLLQNPIPVQSRPRWP